MNLYDLKEQYIRLLEFTDEHGEDEHVLATMDGLDDDIETKADNYVYVIKQLMYEGEMFRSEGQKMYKKARERDKRIEEIKKRLENVLIELDKRKFKTDMNSFYFRKNRASVEIDDNADIPEQFLAQQKPKPDKNAIKDYLEAGNEIEGVRMKQTESLVIQ